MKNSVLIVLLFGLAMNGLLVAQETQIASPKSPADAYWEGKVAPYLEFRRGLNNFLNQVPKEAIQPVERAFWRTLRANGLAFAQQFPADQRWKRWLVATVERPPSEAAPNPDAEASWDREYETLRARYLSSAFSTAEERSALWLTELRRRVNVAVGLRSVVRTDPKGEKARALRHELQDEILRLADLEIDWDQIRYGNRDLRICADFVADTWQDNHAEQKAFLERLSACGNVFLQQYAAGRKLITQFAAQPVVVEFNAIDGREVRTATLKGKVVIVQYWSTGCAGCVAQLPMVKRIYEKYRHQGLEVIGLSGDREAATVIEFTKARGLDWPQRVDYARTRQEFARYGFTWASNFFILDKQGHLARFETGFSETDLEATVRQLLGLPAAAAGGQENAT